MRSQMRMTIGHVVLDQQDRQPAVAQDAQPSRELGGLAVVEARGGLVEQQQRRAQRQRARDLEVLLLAVGEVAGRLVGGVE